MPSREQLETALRNADAAGDYEAATQLANALKSMGVASQPGTQKDLGFIESIGESITGARRSTAETESLPEWTGMPELNQMSMASFKSALGTLLSNPQETVQILQNNFPGIKVRQDEKGNFILRSSVDQNEYAIPPGFSVGDIPRALGGLLAFTPAGRATTIPGAVVAGAGTQAAIEASQAGTGGSFDVGDVGMAGVTGGAGQVIQRGIQAAVPAVKKAVQAVTGRGSSIPQPAPSISAAAAQATTEQPAVRAATESFDEIGELIRKASGSGAGSATAKARLADIAQVNPSARKAAEDLGMDLPFDVFSDNPQIRAAVGLTRSVAGSEAEAAWTTTVRNAIEKADDVVQQFDAAFVGGRPAPGVTSQRILDSLKQTQGRLHANAKDIYNRIDKTIPVNSTVKFQKLKETLNSITTEVGKGGLMPQEKRLLDIVKGNKYVTDAPTYGLLVREKNLIGQALEGVKSPYGNMEEGALKRLYAALAEDQLSNVGRIGGDALRRELRAANLLTAKKKALEKRIVGAFGRDIDGSVANLMQSAIKSASKGDAMQFNKLMKVVPPELRKETVATALASVSSSSRAGQEGAFGFAEFAKTYRGLRANPAVYNRIADTLGEGSRARMHNLYEISRRMTEARAQVLTTGKANQALVQSLKADGLVGKVMQSAMAQRAVTGTAGLVPGGGFVAPDIVKFMSSKHTDATKAAGKLFASDEFQKLAVDIATNPEVKNEMIEQVAKHKAFVDFANAIKLPRSLDDRVRWLQTAIQAESQFNQETQ